jgi:peptidoglycan/LPS O-acetylase OafA/YrhL
MNYIKPLDSVRAIAIILVLMTHWLPYPYIDSFRLGGIGVDMFFVLSGFLITRILLENKKYVEENGFSKRKVIKDFVIRRALRIFPTYYLTLFLIFMFNIQTGHSADHHYSYSVFYLSNILFFFKQGWDGLLSHLWSLAVEEQFYLIWPWIILFVPCRYLFTTIVTVVVLGVSSNYLFSWVFPGAVLVDVLTPTCFDAFGLGAVFAYLMAFKQDKIEIFSRYLSYLAILCLFTFLNSVLFNAYILPRRMLVSVFSLYFIVFAIRQPNSMVHKLILNRPVMVFIGKISYGIYLYHSFMPWLWENFVKILDGHSVRIPLVNSYIPGMVRYELVFAWRFIAVIFISWLSWRYIERPIGRFKQWFAYKNY